MVYLFKSYGTREWFAPQMGTSIAAAFVENPMAFYVGASIIGALCIFAPDLYQGRSHDELHHLFTAHATYQLVWHQPCKYCA